ncbi:hypothetical protein [Streptomyces sp. SAI-127]|nr:hypothetical protein [Streptomyces sp. SAI-127]MDH6486657.1 hypothetical protein [Streptomyces sp. SAI-127]
MLARPARDPAMQRGFGLASVAAAAITSATMAGAPPADSRRSWRGALP